MKTKTEIGFSEIAKLAIESLVMIQKRKKVNRSLLMGNASAIAIYSKKLYEDIRNEWDKLIRFILYTLF